MPPLVTCQGLPGPDESRCPGQPWPRTKQPGKPRCHRRHPGPAISAGGRASPPCRPTPPPSPARVATADTPQPHRPGSAWNSRPDRNGQGEWAPAPPLVTGRGFPGPCESRRPGQPRPGTKQPGQPHCHRQTPRPGHQRRWSFKPAAPASHAPADGQINRQVNHPQKRALRFLADRVKQSTPSHLSATDYQLHTFSAFYASIKGASVETIRVKCVSRGAEWLRQIIRQLLSQRQLHTFRWFRNITPEQLKRSMNPALSPLCSPHLPIIRPATDYP